jgi:hypothetical protein
MSQVVDKRTLKALMTAQVFGSIESLGNEYQDAKEASRIVDLIMQVVDEDMAHTSLSRAEERGRMSHEP